jgi:glycerol kinase
MKLTQRQLDVLSDVLESPQEWADHAETSKGGVASVLAKVAKYESAYDEAVAKGNYLNRKQRDDAEEQAEQERYNNVSYDVKRSREYAPIPDQLDYIYHHGLEKWKADMILPVKEKYPKGAN